MPLISKITPATIREAAKALARGDLVAFPTETVYGLGADATNKIAVKKIYEAKGRPSDYPLIVHISNLGLLSKWSTELPEYASKLARAYWPGPMTLILPRTQLAGDFITGGQDSVAVRIPGQNVALSLLKEFENIGGLGVAAPSANKFGNVSPTTAKAVEEELAESLSPHDYILDFGSCTIGIESTIIDCRAAMPVILRPGAVTIEMIMKVTGILPITTSSYSLKASGMHKSHYKPKARVILNQVPNRGDGFVALMSIKTPPGVIRIASPIDNVEFAQLLYEALRTGDRLNLMNIYIQLPTGDGIALAIKDRLIKAAYSPDQPSNNELH